MVRLINVLVIGLIVYSHIIEQTQQEAWLSQTIHILLLSYAFYLIFQVFSYFVHVRYGKQHKTDSGLKISETYASRGLVIFGGILFFIIWLISIIQTLGLNNLLDAGGVIGFVGVMLALTQGAWAPDIISGLIILNGNMVEEGDILELNYEGKTIYAMVYKTKMFHTELLDLSNNHRMMIKNTRIRDLFIQNLSKFASAKGLREQLSFNIGYDVSPQAVRKLFNEVEKILQKDYADYYESQHPIEIMINNTGDHAVQWIVFFYTKEIRQLLRIRQLFREVVLTQSYKNDISLATPMTHMIASPNVVATEGLSPR
jgi:small-conductance mechanosensitive channel